MGFTFDDTDKKGVASPLSEMHRLIEKDPRNQEAIFPYIGGQEVNTSPTHAHHRYVINFGDFPLRRESVEIGGAGVPEDSRVPAYGLVEPVMSWVDATDEQRRAWLQKGRVPLDYPEPVAADWPDVLPIVEERVRGTRGRHSTAPWWQFERVRPELYAAITGLERVLVISRISNAFGFTLLQTGMVYNEKTIVFPFMQTSALAMLQSRLHEVWARFLSSTLKDDLQYTPSDCFETFPFPESWESDPTLEAAGKEYHDFRAGLMVRNDEGLTTTYNRFHDPYENDPEVAKLRELQAAMDRAVLDAYGWTDMPTDCGFLLDYEINEEEWGNRKKPYRYRWPDNVRDEVFARLLELNAERAAEETRASHGQRRS